MARIPISLESKRRLHEGDPRWISKAALRLISSFFAFLALILFAVAVGKSVQWENTWDDGYGDDWTDGMPLAPVRLDLDARVPGAHKKPRSTRLNTSSPDANHVFNTDNPGIAAGASCSVVQPL